MNSLYRLGIGIAMLGCLYSQTALAAHDGSYDGTATLTNGGPICESGKVSVKIAGSDFSVTRWTKAVATYALAWNGDSFTGVGPGRVTGKIDGDRLTFHDRELNCEWDVDAHRAP